MPSIPLGLQAYSRDASYFPQVELINLFVEEDASGASIDQNLRLQRPGLALYSNVAGPVRGMFQRDGVANSRVFVAAGSSLQTIDGVGIADLGTIVDDGKTVSFAAAFDKLAISSAGRLYFLTDDTRTPVAIPDADTDPNRIAIDITAVSNYIVIACPDGRFYWVAPGESTIDALDFATAESSADGLVAAHALNDELYLFGSNSVEVWQTTGDRDLPFQRAPGRNFARGCLHADTVQILDNTIFFAGNNNVIYRSASVPQRVSTFAIEEHLSNRTGDPSSFVYTLDAHEFYVIKIPGRGSFSYDAATKGWSRLKSLNRVEFRPSHSIPSPAGTLMGDSETGTIWRADRTIATDAGDAIERIVTGTIPLPTRRSTRNNSLSIMVGSSSACTYRLRWHDGQGNYPDRYIILPARAGADTLSLYRLGHGTESYRTFEVSIIDPAIVRISGMVANEAFDR